MNREELIREIRKYRCADLSDAMDALGLVDRGTMNEKMRPLRPGIEFKGFEIPKFKEMIEVCKKAALRVPEVKVIGWDVTVSENGDIVLFEGNPGSGVASMQIADGIGKKDLFYQYLQ